MNKKTKDTDSIKKRSFITIPLSAHGIPVFAVYLISIVGMIYILNPTSGILELIPDNLPIIGNLDEGGAFVAIWYGLLEFFEGKNYKKPENQK